MADVIRGLKFVLSVEGDEKAEAGVKKVDAAVNKADASATKASTGGMVKLQGALKGVTATAGDVGSVLGKMGAALGAVGIGIAAATAAWEGLSKAAKFLNDYLDQGTDHFRVMTEEAVKAKTGLSDLSSQMDAYAKSIDVANGSMLTFGQRQAALRAIADGRVPDTFESAGQKAESVAKAREVIARLRSGPFALDTAAMGRLDAALQARGDQLERTQIGLQGGWFDDEGTRAAPKKTGGGGGARPAGSRNAYSPAELAQMTRDNANIGGRIGFLANARNSAWAEGSGKAIEQAVAAIPQVDQVAAAIDRVGLATKAAFDLELMQQWSDIFTSSIDQFGRGLAQSAANALLFGSSFTKSVNQAMKALAAHAASEALFEGAAAVASLALGRPEAAALHGQAAALYAGVATVAALGASATGGLRSGQQGGGGAGGGRAPRSQDFGPRASSGGPQKQEITVVIDADRLGGSIAYAVDRRDGSRINAGLVTARSQRAA